jgi:hypothetical protein
MVTVNSLVHLSNRFQTVRGTLVNVVLHRYGTVQLVEGHPNGRKTQKRGRMGDGRERERLGAKGL